MYQELVKYPGGSKKENVLYVIAIVLGVFLISILSWFLSSTFDGLPLVDFLAFAALVAWACTIFFKRIVEYRYSLMDTELIIARKVGNNEKNIYSLEVTDITRIEVVDKECKLRTERFTLPTKKLKSVQIILQTDGQDQRVILQPSDHMLQLIRTRAAVKEPKTSAE